MPLFQRLPEMLGLDDFDKRHKTAFVVLACAGILIIVLWAMQLRKNILSPLYGTVDPNAIQQTQTTDPSAELKSKDTDTDGISDYDELNVYKTSPYLADSDSDGINDRDEIQKGTDPNCPTGQTCAVATTPTTQTPVTNQTTTVTPTATPQTNSGSTQLSAEEKTALKQLIGTTTDPATLRALLLQGGADQAYVNSISDADLQKVINEILK